MGHLSVPSGTHGCFGVTVCRAALYTQSLTQVLTYRVFPHHCPNKRCLKLSPASTLQAKLPAAVLGGANVVFDGRAARAEPQRVCAAQGSQAGCTLSRLQGLPLLSAFFSQLHRGLTSLLREQGGEVWYGHTAGALIVAEVLH